MHQKTRYNIRPGGTQRRCRARRVYRRPVRLLRPDASHWHARWLCVHSAEYYRAAFELFVPQGWARLLIAEVHDEPVAAIMVFAFGSKAWYMYGASGDAHRERMPNHALQWEAIRWSKSKGCATYDLWGVPDEDETALDAQYLNRSDGLWGVYRFKRGFGGRLVRYAGAFDRVYDPLWYRLFLLALRWRGDMVS